MRPASIFGFSGGLIRQPGRGIRPASLSVPYLGPALGRTLLNIRAPAGGAAPQSLTNVEKLSLDPASPVGKQVSVTDAFVVTGFGDARDGFYAPYDTSNGAVRFVRPGHVPDFDNPTNDTPYVEWSGGANWKIVGDTPTNDDGNGTIVGPWTSTWITEAPAEFVLTNPAIQQLTTPSTAQGGVFVAGGTQDGVYTKQGTYNSRDFFILLGALGIDPENNSAVTWIADGARWTITTDGSQLYYSNSDVATPDLATNWKNASDDSPADITVTSVTEGLLAAGFVMVGSDVADTNDVYVASGNAIGRNSYRGLVTSRVLAWNGSRWSADSTFATPRSSDNTSTPIDAVFSNSAVITRDDVASESSWEVVP